MDENPDKKQELIDFLKQRMFVVIVIVLGIAMIVIGGVQYLASNSEKESIEFVKNAEVNEVKGISDIEEVLTVDVSGEVENPGVYELESGSRVQDALEAAGGLSSNADREYISKRFNLAQKLVDGVKIYVPDEGEMVDVTPGFPGNDSTEFINYGMLGDDNIGLININNASESQLDTLPQVGPATSRKIIEGRPYMTKEELVSKKVVGQKTYEGLKDLISTE